MIGFDPDREAFVASLAGRDEPAVAHVAVPIDREVTPLAAYAALVGRDDYGFLLESAEKTPSSDPDGAFGRSTDGDRHARYSFVGFDPEAVVSVTDEGTEVESLGGRAADLIDPGEGDVLDRLRGALPDLDRVGFPGGERQALEGGLVGFLAYDAVYDLWLEEVGVERP
ncbi:MAG: anthranilate synthase component I, partial [Haloferacaceae archaeon]